MRQRVSTVPGAPVLVLVCIGVMPSPGLAVEAELDLYAWCSTGNPALLELDQRAKGTSAPFTSRPAFFTLRPAPFALRSFGLDAPVHRSV
jgi:hypothetical protein